MPGAGRAFSTDQAALLLTFPRFISWRACAALRLRLLASANAKGEYRQRFSAPGHPTPPIEISNFRSGPRKFIKLFQLLSSGWKITQVASLGENSPRREHFRAIFRHRTSHANLRTLAITREFRRAISGGERVCAVGNGVGKETAKANVSDLYFSLFSIF